MGLLATLKRILASAATARSPEPSADSPGADARLAIAGAHWGQRAREQIAQVRPSSWTECPVVIAEYMNPLISGRAEVGWLEAVARAHRRGV